MEKNIKKLGKITIALAVLIITISAAAALPTANNFGVKDATGDQNTYVEVPVNITNVQNDSIASIIFDITFDPSVLNLTKVNMEKKAALGDLTSQWDSPFFNPLNGRIGLVYGGSGTEIPVGASGSVVMLNFSVVGAPGSQSTMNISRIQLSNLTGNVGTATPMNGIFTVEPGPNVTVSPTVSPTPTVTVTATPTVTLTATPTVTATPPKETRRVDLGGR